MILPCYAEFKKLARQGNLIALRSDGYSDLDTPVSAFQKLAGREANAFLLESAEQEERMGRYSFLGINPERILKPQGNGKIVEEIRKTLSCRRLANPEGLPGFAGGLVGFLGYENVRHFEDITLQRKTGVGIEDSIFFLVKDFLLFDHFRKTLSVVSLCSVDGRGEGRVKRAYKEGVKRIKTLESRLKQGKVQLRVDREGRRRRLKSNMTYAEFSQKVRKIQRYIRAGDCIQAVLSQRFAFGRVNNDFEIYRALRSINPSPYMFYFRCGGIRLIGSSPEVLVKKTGRVAEVRPIAGTRPRGETETQDKQLEENLRRSPKEMAEHLMLVDLGRNDLGRVCDFKSVQVCAFARVERYSHVMHLVSDVKGRLKTGKDAVDLLQATFPAGTVTGAPKIRAIEIIDELESERRGPYAGSLGYFSFNGDMDMCITIRTIVVHRGRAYVQAGAGIVYDSKPSREFEETVNKAKALVQAVERAA